MYNPCCTIQAKILEEFHVKYEASCSTRQA